MLRRVTNSFHPLLRARQTQFMVNLRQLSVDYPQTDGLIIERKDRILWIKFNRPQKFNAITREMYTNMDKAFNLVNKDTSVKAVVLTGEGDYYSSGNDLSNFTLAMKDKDGPKAGLTKSRDILYSFVNSLINLEKLLIAALNGPAVGIPVTTLPLCDYVIASDKATFQAPFTALGQCAEACSSYTFPRIMGPSRSNELLLLNASWDAKKAKDYGLISDVIEHDKFQATLENLLYGKHGIVNSCYPNSLRVSKSLIRDTDLRKKLLDVNRRECDEILKLWLGEECAEALQKFFARTKK